MKQRVGTRIRRIKQRPKGPAAERSEEKYFKQHLFCTIYPFLEHCAYLKFYCIGWRGNLIFLHIFHLYTSHNVLAAENSILNDLWKNGPSEFCPLKVKTSWKTLQKF